MPACAGMTNEVVKVIVQLTEQIDKAVTVLRAGGLVAMPTETVYGLGADARNETALRKIFQAKQRPVDHPLIVHLADVSQLSLWAKNISAQALLLAKTFWPGPLTLILQKAEGVSDLVTGGQDTIGIRIPHHPVAQQLLRTFGSGIAAPSANRFGRISPTTSVAVREELGDTVDLILEGGQCEVGVESTIVDVSGKEPAILRPGMITAEQIAAVLQQTVTAKEKNVPRVSGSHELHYAPMTKTVLVPSAELKNFLANLNEKDFPVAVMSFEKVSAQQTISVLMSRDVKQYAHDLYQVLRDLDKEHVQQIIIEAVPQHAAWDAIRDRLQRAAHS